MAKVNWATASEKLKEVKDILNQLVEDNKPYTISIGSEKTPILEVIDRIRVYGDQLSHEVHFTNAPGIAASTPTSTDIPTPAADTAKPKLFG